MTLWSFTIVLIFLSPYHIFQFTPQGKAKTSQLPDLIYRLSSFVRINAAVGPNKNTVKSLMFRNLCFHFWDKTIFARINIHAYTCVVHFLGRSQSSAIRLLGFVFGRQRQPQNKFPCKHQWNCSIIHTWTSWNCILIWLLKRKCELFSWPIFHLNIVHPCTCIGHSMISVTLATWILVFHQNRLLYFFELPGVPALKS